MGKTFNLRSAVAAACVAGIASAQAGISSFDPALQSAFATAEAEYQSRDLLNFAAAGNTGGQCQSLLDVAGAERDLRVLTTGIEASELANVTSIPDAAYTILAPTNAAFLAVPREEIEALVNSPEALTQLLNAHVIEGAVKAADLTEGQQVVTLAGDILTVSLAFGSVTFTASDGTSATVTQADLMSCSGVIRKIDTMLVPGVLAGAAFAPAPGPAGFCGSIMDVLEEAFDLNTLVQAVDAAALTAVLNDTEAVLTVLAPTDEAFGSIPQETLMELLDQPDALGELLGVHVLTGVYTATDLAALTEVETMEGLNLTVAVQDGIVAFTAPSGGSTAFVSEADLISCQGVVHKINNLLVPGVDVTANGSGVGGEATAVPAPTTPSPTPTPDFTPTPARTSPTPTPDLTPTPARRSPTPTPEFTTTPVSPTPGCGSLLDVANGAGHGFDSLISALEVAGLTATVADPDASLTLLAPDDAAFATIPEEDLAALMSDPAALAFILNMHIINGAVTAADLTDGQQVTTLGGEILTVGVADGTVQRITFTAPNGGSTVQVITSDLMSCQGVVHVISSVITPGVPGAPTL